MCVCACSIEESLHFLFGFFNISFFFLLQKKKFKGKAEIFGAIGRVPQPTDFQFGSTGEDGATDEEGERAFVVFTSVPGTEQK